MKRLHGTALLTAVLGFSLMPGIATAQWGRSVNKVGTTAAAFLEFGVGSRALAMGEAFVAQADDITATYWNPAGLADLEGTQVLFYQSPWVAGIVHSDAIIAVPLNRLGTVGFFLTSLTMDDMIVRTVEKPDGTGESFTASNIVLGASFARNLTDRFRFGANIKFISEQIWHMSASTVAFDLGTMFTSKHRGIRIGMSISNFGSKMRLRGRDTQTNVDIDENKAGNNDRIAASLDTQAWPLPLIFRVGISSRLMQVGSHKLVMAADAIQPNNQHPYSNVGFEYSWLGMVFLRAGLPELSLADSEKGLTLGGGVRYRSGDNFVLILDYVSRDMGLLGSIEGYTLALQF